MNRQFLPQPSIKEKCKLRLWCYISGDDGCREGDGDMVVVDVGREMVIWWWWM